MQESTDQNRPAPRRDDPRPAQTRQLVLHAARMIIASDGQPAVTPTRLVAMSGVARSTIYRYWPDAEAIIADALQSNAEDTEFHSSGDPEADLRAYLGQLRDLLESAASTMVIAQADLAERDDQAEATLSGNARYRNQLIKELLQDPRQDFDSIHAQLVGPLFMQRYFIRGPITDRLIDDIVSNYMTSRLSDERDDTRR